MTCGCSAGQRLAAALALSLSLRAGAVASAQTSSGTIVGAVSDQSGAVVAGAVVTITRLETGIARIVVTSDDGRYAAPILTPGPYSVRAESTVLHSSVRSVLVQAGMTMTVDLVVTIDPVVEVVTVDVTPWPHNDHHEVGAWIDRLQIERNPLNGRTILELAKLEPGIRSPERLPGGRVFIAPLGAGLQTIPRVGFTLVTLDGGNIETPGTVGTILQISPEVVDQLHISTVNFDASTGPATSGAVNVITRSGGSRYHGGAFSLYRDRQWSAYPLESSGAASPDPSFRRHQAGGTLGGPVRANRAFFFAGYERHDQRDAVSVLPADADLRPLGGAFESPYSGTLVSGRIDVRLTDRHRAYVRHTHDINRSFSPNPGPQLPSAWGGATNRAYQTLGSITSVLSSTVVNDLRVSTYRTWQAREPAGADTCLAPCTGLGAPGILLSDGGQTVLALGAGTSARVDGRRLQASDSIVWQKGSHLIRIGVDWEHTEHAQSIRDSDPVQMTLWTPASVRLRTPDLPLPASLSTLDDILRLPLRSFTTSIGSGDVLQRGFQPTRRFDLLRLHIGDQWSAGDRFTVNAGLAWTFEPGVLNSDLAKPAWLAPLVGAGGLRVPDAHSHVSSLLGFVWKAGGDGRTTVRGGVGRYVESIARTVALNLANERVLLSPLGTGRFVVSGTNVIRNGQRLNFPVPSSFTGADLMAILPDLRASIALTLDPDNRDFSVVNLDGTKEGRNLYDPGYTTPRAVHASVGVEHDVGWDTVVSADLTWKRFSHTFINGIDYNRFFSAAGPVIPACTPAERGNVTAICSNGSLFFDTTSGRARHLGLMVRIEKRFSHGVHLLASYALGSFVGSNGTGTGTTESSGGRVFGFNNDDWFENYGPLPTDIRHVFNLSGFVVGPWDFEVSFNLSAYGRAPFSAYVAGMDFNGDGTMNDLLPGTRVNQFNRGQTQDDLVRLVEAYNDRYAGRPTPGGQTAPVVTLPDEYAFNDSFFTLDARAARAFRTGSWARLSVFVDIFNVLNALNLTGYSGNLAAPESFGRPSGRVGQAFGSGGPRAAQLGVRVSF